MSTNYPQLLSSFPSGLDVDRFTSEIRNSAIVTALDFIYVLDPNVDIWFKAALSGGDQTILTGLVAAHSGLPLPDAPLTIFINEDSDRTITGNQTWDRSQGGILVPPAGTAFPVSPTEGELFFRTDLGLSYRRTAGVWVSTSPSAPVTSVFGRTGAVVQVSGDYTATQTTFTPNGDIVATEVQAAIVEVRDDTDTKLSTKAPNARNLTAGAGLTGGGDLSADRTFNVAANVDASIVVNANDIQVGVLASDAQHGTRGGGTIHAAATTLVNGFMSGTDKTKLDGIAPGAQVNTVTSVFGRTGAVVAVSGDYTATQTTFTPNGNIAATNVQAAIVEVRDESVQDGDTAGGQLGGTYPNPDVRGVRETSGPTSLTIGTIADGEFLKRVGVTLVSAVPPTAPVTSVFGRTGAVVATSGDYTASQVTFTPNGDIAAVTTQAAIVEVRDDTDTKLSSKVTTSTTITAGNGLTGGGDLSANRTLDVVANVDGSIVVNANDIQVGVLASDAQHGVRGGGTQHASVTTLVNGFMSASDKTKLDGIASGAQVNTVTSVFGRTGAIVAVSGDYTASQTTFTPNGNIAATNAQAAIQEVRDESVQDGDAAGGQLGGTYPNPDVRGLRETSGPTSLTIGTIADGEFLKRVGTTLVSSAPPSAPVTSVFGRTGAVVSVAGDYTAAQITFTPSGDIVATTAQAAIVEVRDDTDTKLSSKASTATTITAGAGLTGGGDLSTNRTLNVAANADASIVVNADDIQVGVLASDAQHGTRGGGTIHAAVTTLVNGFMSSADKTKLDGVASGATNTPLASTAPENVTKSTAVIGVSTTAARSDHKHDITTAEATANPPGTASAEGSATSLARSDHTHALHAYGTGASTICQGNDSRLSDDRTASGLRSASTVVSVSGATAPTVGQVLTATSDTNATWQTPGVGSSVYVKSAMSQITVNTTTVSTVFVDLLTVNITAAGANFFKISAAGAISNANANINMRLRVTVDGVSVGGAQMRSPATNIAMGFAIITRVAVAAGARVVKLQWATASATMQCRPTTNIDAERACLIVEEVTA